MYKFKSKVTGDLIMLEPNGRQILRIIGKDDTDSLAKGILLPADIPAALVALEAAIRDDEARQQHGAPDSTTQSEEPAHAERISLRQRAAPFIEMLKRCRKEDHEVVWGV